MSGINLISHLKKNISKWNALWNGKISIQILRNNDTKQLELMNYVPIYPSTNPRLYFLCPLSPATYIYSHPFPPFLLNTKELANSKVDCKFVSADGRATDNSWVYSAVFPWAEGLTWHFLLLPAIHSHHTSQNYLLDVCLYRVRVISRFKNDRSDWQSPK